MTSVTSLPLIFLPRIDEAFAVQFKGGDRSYSTEVWVCKARNSELIIGHHAGEPRYINQITLRIDEWIFTPISPEFLEVYIAGQK